MKSFDFPVVFNYVVEKVNVPKENNDKNASPFKSHIDLDKLGLGKPQVAPCKQFLFSKRKLIDIKPNTVMKIQPPTSSSEDSSKRNTAPFFREYLLRKTLSHKTHFLNPKDNSFNTNKSLESQKSIKKIFVQQPTNNTNRSSLNGLKKASVKIIEEKKQRRRIRFEDEKQNSANGRQDTGRNSSKYSGSKITSRHDLGSKKLIERSRTQADDPNKEFTNKKLKSVKKVTKFLSRKNTIAANKSQIQKSQSGSEDEKTRIQKSQKKLKLSKKKTTFPDLEKDFDEEKEHNETMKTFKSQSKKTMRSKGTLSKINRLKESSEMLTQSRGNLANEKDRKSRCSIVLKEDKISFLKDLKLGEKDYTLEMKSEPFLHDPEKEELKSQLDSKYISKSEKLIRPHDPNFLDDFKGTLTRLISNTSLTNFGKKTQNVKVLKKKKHERQPQDHVMPYSSRKILKRVKKSSKDEARAQQGAQGKRKQENAGEKIYQQKSTFHIKRPEYINAFTELNLFHKMMKEFRDMQKDEKNDNDNAKEVAPNKPFAMLGEETDKRDLQALEDRRRQFEYEEMMLRFSKNFMTTANRLKQVNVHTQ